MILRLYEESLYQPCRYWFSWGYSCMYAVCVPVTIGWIWCFWTNKLMHIMLVWKIICSDSVLSQWYVIWCHQFRQTRCLFLLLLLPMHVKPRIHLQALFLRGCLGGRSIDLSLLWYQNKLHRGGMGKTDLRLNLNRFTCFYIDLSSFIHALIDLRSSYIYWYNII